METAGAVSSARANPEDGGAGKGGHVTGRSTSRRCWYGSRIGIRDDESVERLEE